MKLSALIHSEKGGIYFSFTNQDLSRLITACLRVVNVKGSNFDFLLLRPSTHTDVV